MSGGGSTASSLQSLREYSSENSEFELVDIVDPRLSASLGVLRSNTSLAVQSPVTQNPMFIQSLEQKDTKKHSKPHGNVPMSTIPTSVWLENERLRTELAEANAQLAMLNKEVEAFRLTLRTDEGEESRRFGKAMENDGQRIGGKPSTNSQEPKNSTKTSSMCATLDSQSVLQGSKTKSPQNIFGGRVETTKFKELPHAIAQTFPQTQRNKKFATEFGVRSASSPPLPKLSPPRTVADAQLLDLLGNVQTTRDANRPAAPPPTPNAWCKVCGQWLCNSYFLRAHMQSQHAVVSNSDSKQKGGKNQKTAECEKTPETFVNNSSIQCSTSDELMVENGFFETNPSKYLINVDNFDGEALSTPRVTVNPKPIRPVPMGQFRIKWEEDEEETEEEKEEEESSNGEKDGFSWSLIGEVSTGRANKTKLERVNSKKKSDGILNGELVYGTQQRHYMDIDSLIGCNYESDSPTPPPMSPFASDRRPLSCDLNHQKTFCSSTSPSSESALGSTTESTTNLTNDGSEEQGRVYDQRRRGNRQDQEEKGSASHLDNSILDRLLYIGPPGTEAEKPKLDARPAPISPSLSLPFVSNDSKDPRVDEIEFEEWYAGDIERSLAEKLVLADGKMPRGTFLVRKRAKEGSELALTLNDSNGAELSVKHYKIHALADGSGFFITPRRTFPTVQSLIAHYSKETDGLCHILTNPPALRGNSDQTGRGTANYLEISREGSPLTPTDGTSMQVQPLMGALNYQLCTLRYDLHTLQDQHEQNGNQTNERLDTLESRMTDVNLRLCEFNAQRERIRGEQRAQLETLMLGNGRLCEESDEHKKRMEVVQSRIELLEQCRLREFVKSISSVNGDGSLVLSQPEMGDYCEEIKLLFQLGSQFCTGLAIRGSANFRNYPPDLFNQLIEHALTTREVPKMINWAVLNFPADEKPPWPQALKGNRQTDEGGSNSVNNQWLVYQNLIRRCEVLTDRVVYSLTNQHSSHKFVVDVYYASAVELFKQMHCFTIRRRRSR
ncbi:hypothetical protein GPALN_005582 [Globodera pallida]|nr:hypothetical protein GPALN_005582 [Globodera pallida]